MKINYFFSHIVCGVFFVCQLISGQHVYAEKTHADRDESFSEAAFNRLNWVDVTSGISTQIMFDFAQPVYFKKKSIAQKHEVRLTFPGMRLKFFNSKHVLLKLAKLKAMGLVRSVNLEEKTTKYPKVVLTIDFEPFKKGGDVHDDKAVKNSLVIKWCKLEEPNRLILDIFTQDSLAKLDQQQGSVFLAQNEKKTQKKNYRIVLDAGHGGSDAGAERFGLKEKDLALDIALRTRALFQKHGVTTLLTRNDDETLSLADRIEFANQLKAHLFVAIHLNATAVQQEKISGVETFHLNTKCFNTPHASQGFLTLQLSPKDHYIDMIEKFYQRQHNASGQLALSIQQSVLESIKKKHNNIIDRGVKTDLFRIFFNNGTPTALVEVGFLTNPDEAKRLAQAGYRQLIAQGIYSGIKHYLEQGA